MQRPLRIVPPRGVLIALALPVGLILWAQLTEATGDGGMNNAISYVAGLISLLLYGVWFLIGSGVGARGRVRCVIGALALLVAVVATVRIDGWTGASVPELRFVWTKPNITSLQGGSVALATPEGRSAERPSQDPGAPARADFPGFLGPERSAVVHGIRLVRDWQSHPPTLVWREPVGAGWSGFAVVAGVAYTQEQRGDEQLVVARDVATGQERWRHAHPAHFDHSLGGPGPRATPEVAHGRVYAHDTAGLLVCLDAVTGALEWQHDLKAEYGMTDALEAELIAFGRSPSPLVHGDLVIIPAGGDPGGKRAGLVAFDTATGALIWEGPPRDISHSSPNIATLAGVEQVLVVNVDTVSGHDPKTGALLWEHPWPGKTSADANNSQPVPIAPDKVLVSKGYGQGSQLLQLTASAEGALTAAPVWTSRRALRTKFTNAALRDGYAYALSDGILECVALDTGDRVWRDGRYGHGQVLLVEDLLLVMSEEGELSLVEATPERENHVLGAIQALDGKSWNTIALYGDLVLVRNGTEAAAWRVALAP
ncbi:MAG: PQQ-binding-like beta-propeller repeat protein [Planctomycetota bacterium]